MAVHLKQTLIVTPGDPEGVGPEIVWKTLKKRAHPAHVNILCIGARKPFDKLHAPVVEFPSREFPDRPFVWLLPAPTKAPEAIGRPSAALAGFQSGWSIQKAVELIRKGFGSALVTGPISKERLQAGGYPYPGHTELLANLCGVKRVTMMLANDFLKISLVSTHLALKDVPRALTQTSIKRTVVQTAVSLKNWWGIKKPRIAVAALNPHAGECGLFGREEIEVIVPALKALARNTHRNFSIHGPLPADTLFAQHIAAPRSLRYDAVVCMYHDQGLIPVKLLDFPRTVNVTLGLPIVRTSVDHGVGFDIVGTGKADPSSLQSALALAARLATKGN